MGGIIETQQHVRNGADPGPAGARAGPVSRHQPDVGFYHVAGVLVHASPALEHDVRSAIESMPGAIVHAHVDCRIVATLEGGRSRDISRALDSIQTLTGVLSAVLVSEHSEPLETLDEEMPNGR